MRNAPAAIKRLIVILWFVGFIPVLILALVTSPLLWIVTGKWLWTELIDGPYEPSALAERWDLT